jgi:hypothetical protein
MTRQDDATRASAAFLKSEHAVEDDARLISQVQFWQVGGEIYETFGIDVERPLSAEMIEPLRRFSIKLDGIRADWSARFTRNEFVGNYPRKGVGLHYHFLKLYLTSMAFRGIGKQGFKAPDVALDIDEIANSALLSAVRPFWYGFTCLDEATDACAVSHRRAFRTLRSTQSADRVDRIKDATTTFKSQRGFEVSHGTVG